jgi:hypothetical protein
MLQTQNEILELAVKIAALLKDHPNVYEAKTACSIAQELVSFDIDKQSRRGVNVNQCLEH